MAAPAGPYDQLGETYAALDGSERFPPWRGAMGVVRHGSGRLPDPTDWRTEVYWPLAE